MSKTVEQVSKREGVREAGAVKSRLIPELLNALIAAPEKLIFSTGTAR